MLELIFKGLFQWLYELFLELVEYVSNALLDVFSMNLAYFFRTVPIATDIMDILRAVGWALLLGNLVFQAAKSMMSGIGFEAEDPKLLFTRTFVFAFLLVVSDRICAIGLGMTQTIIQLLQVPSSVTIQVPGEAIFNTGAAWILVIIIGIVVGWQYIKLCIEVGERYVVLASLTILAPVAFGVGGSQSTSDIFKGWARMFGSMCFMMVSNVIFLKMLISALAYVPAGLDAIPWAILILAIAKVARKVDEIITRIGLNPAITGGGLGRNLPGMLAYTVVRGMTSTIGKSIGKAAGGPNKTPPTGDGSGAGAGPTVRSGRKQGGWQGRYGYSPYTSPSSKQKAGGGATGPSATSPQNDAAGAHFAPSGTRPPETGADGKRQTPGTEFPTSANSPGQQHGAEMANAAQDGKDHSGTAEQERGVQDGASRRSSVPPDGQVMSQRPRPPRRAIDVDASDFEDGDIPTPGQEQPWNGGMAGSGHEGEDSKDHPTRYTNVPADTSTPAPKPPPQPLNTQMGGQGGYSGTSPVPRRGDTPETERHARPDIGAAGMPPTGGFPRDQQRDAHAPGEHFRPATGPTGISPTYAPAPRPQETPGQDSPSRPEAGAAGTPPASGAPTPSLHDAPVSGGPSRPAAGGAGTPPAGGAPTHSLHDAPVSGGPSRLAAGGTGTPPAGGASSPVRHDTSSRPAAGAAGSSAPSTLTVNQGGSGPVLQETSIHMTESGHTLGAEPSAPQPGAPSAHTPKAGLGSLPTPPRQGAGRTGPEAPYRPAPQSQATGKTPSVTAPMEPTTTFPSGRSEAERPLSGASVGTTTVPPVPKPDGTTPGPKPPEQPKGVINQGTPRPGAAGIKKRKKKSRRGKGGK